MSKTLTRKLLTASTVGILVLGGAACTSDDVSPTDDPVDEVDPIVDEGDGEIVDE